MGGLPRLGSICSGIGGAELAFHDLAEPIFASEIEPFPRAVLAKRFPGLEVHGDFTQLIPDPPLVDILTASCPCQAFSTAGLRQSLADDRGNLTLQYVRLLNAMDDKRAPLRLPPVVSLFENVPGILSTKDNAFGCLLGALVGHDAALEPPTGSRWSGGRAPPGRGLADPRRSTLRPRPTTPSGVRCRPCWYGIRSLGGSF